jgi:hypothetical protein
MVKSFKRLLPALLIALLVLVPALPVFAQGSSQGICDGLSDADCQTLATAQANLSGVTSFSSAAWSIDLKASSTSADVVFSGSGAGEFVLPSGSDGAGLLIHLMINDLTESVGSTNITMKDAEVILTDKMAYVKYNGDWYGKELTAQDLNNLGLGSLNGLGSMLGSANGGSANGMSMMNAIDLTGVVTTTRGADTTAANGDSVQVFTTTFDLGKLISAVLTSPAAAPLLGTSDSAMTPDQLQSMGSMFTPMLGTTSLNLEEWVGTDANLHEIKLNMVLDIDPSLFSPGSGKITGNFSFSTDLSGINQSYSVTPPDSYKPMSDLNITMSGMPFGG